MEIPSLVHDVNVESQVVNNKGNLKQQKKFQCWFAKDTLLDWKKNNALEELKDFSLNGNISEHRSQWYQNWHHTDDKNNSQMDLLSMWWVSVTCSKLLKKKALLEDFSKTSFHKSRIFYHWSWWQWHWWWLFTVM